ncbi:hypothetical protein BDZ94DRAFT_1252471 [Collybia nuda]|uniref:CUE domain-containing protein n=1 Tax=Collybia nuda TaxID=64659 RepID=A0A9P5YBT8_9AGAR|nr:hypothetical protein BDZ94DRAFT_1252471 [Collybia nuda]
MGEVVNVLVAFAVIVFIFRWATSSNDTTERSAADTLGFRPKPVTQDMINTISNMFPDIPVDNVRYDLLRTGSVEMTTNKILERGFLDAPPPAYYALFPRETNPTPARAQPSAVTTKSIPKESLISRYHLEERIVTEKPVPEEMVGGKAIWEDSPEKREASLRERKAMMILAARQRMLSQQEKA